MTNMETLEKAFANGRFPAGLPEINQEEYLINGELRKWTGEFQNILSPMFNSKGEQFLIGKCPCLTEKESMEALVSAENAYKHWSVTPLDKRISHVLKFVELMRLEREEVVQLLMWEIGKTRKFAETEFDRTIEDILAKVEEAKKMDREDSRLVVRDDIIAQVRRAPLGVSLLLGPFNYPLNETYTLLFPALIMGNVVITKLPKIGILLHYPLLKAFQQAFPAGVVNTIYGDGAKIVNPLMASGKIDVLGFIGTSKVANLIKKQHPKLPRLHSIVGAEAKNPAIICEDADLNVAVKECVTGALSYNGQRCTALKILFVEKSISAEFINRFVNAVDQLKVGLPWETNADLTPLPEPNKTKWLKDYVDDAIAHGAKLANDELGGGMVYGTYFHPAILVGVTPEMKIYHEEQFGPIVPIVIMEHTAEFCDYVRNEPYGQQASVFSSNPNVVGQFIDFLSRFVCRININCQCQRGPDDLPFTGRKDSAEGVVSNSDTMKFFSIRTLAAFKAKPSEKQLVREIVQKGHSTFLNNNFII
jgi:glyceraldehyde-3-phosphate dehydrogenase (NADP+)